MNRFAQSFTDADAAFSGHYQEVLKQLKGLSEEEIAAVIPDTASADVYKELIEVVEEASQKNMAQAELVAKIKHLGGVAVTIARKIPGLASLF